MYVWMDLWIMDYVDYGFTVWGEGGVGLATPSFSLHLRERVKSMDNNFKKLFD